MRASNKDRYDTEGSEYVHKIVREKSESQQPLQLVLPGFPLKNPDRMVTMSSHADAGDVEAIRTLHRLVNDLANVYKHGVEVGCL